MNSFDRLPALDDHYCQVCSKSNNGNERRLSCFNCEHCRLSMCYDCFEKHTNDLIKDYSQIQQKFIDFSSAAEQKREFLRTFRENSMRAVDATFDEIIKDLETLRHESLTYVQQQFRDAEVRKIENQTEILSNFVYFEFSSKLQKTIRRVWLMTS